MKTDELKKIRRIRRKHHIRKTVFGNQERPRLTVFKSLKHIYVQLIDDVNGRTVLSSSSLDKDVMESLKPGTKKVDVSKAVGKAIGKKAIDANINMIVFDRNGYLYHGRIKALADAAREAGLNF